MGDLVKVGPFETRRELGGLFMVGAARQVGVGRVLDFVFLLFPSLGCLFSFFILRLISFLFG
jgi:hypothetical protein